MKLYQIYQELRQNRWMRYFTVFTRIMLAIGFFGAGMQKIMGIRFTSLSVNHPMGNYLEALWRTGFYYNWIGVAQVAASVMLLFRRTALFGALLYFPVILNICLLSLSVRFEGSLITSPLMVVANLYLLLWDYDRLKYILPFQKTGFDHTDLKVVSNKFPLRFFAGGSILVAAIILTLTTIFDIMPRNMESDCKGQCDGSKDPQACINFCDCIHKEGKSLNKCLEAYHQAIRKR